MKQPKHDPELNRIGAEMIVMRRRIRSEVVTTTMQHALSPGITATEHKGYRDFVGRLSFAYPNSAGIITENAPH